MSYILLLLGQRRLFVTSRTSLYTGSLHRGSTVRECNAGIYRSLFIWLYTNKEAKKTTGGKK